MTTCPHPKLRKFSTEASALARLATIAAYPHTSVIPSRAFECGDHWHLARPRKLSMPQFLAKVDGDDWMDLALYGEIKAEELPHEVPSEVVGAWEALARLRPAIEAVDEWLEAAS